LDRCFCAPSPSHPCRSAHDSTSAVCVRTLPVHIILQYVYVHNMVRVYVPVRTVVGEKPMIISE
jgi:hypothetical protein